jgi:hypothetical protein
MSPPLSVAGRSTTRACRKRPKAVLTSPCPRSSRSFWRCAQQSRSRSDSTPNPSWQLMEAGTECELVQPDSRQPALVWWKVRC